MVLMDALRVMVNNPFKEMFYEEKNNNNNVLTAFFISHKNDIKTFLKWIINHYSKSIR